MHVNIFIIERIIWGDFKNTSKTQTKNLNIGAFCTIKIL